MRKLLLLSMAWSQNGQPMKGRALAPIGFLSVRVLEDVMKRWNDGRMLLPKSPREKHLV